MLRRGTNAHGSRPFRPWPGPDRPEKVAPAIARRHAAPMTRQLLLICAALTFVTSLAAQQPAGQPWKGQNLKYFPADITREALVQRMREFSFALNVRCQHCHAGGDGISLDGVDFASDEKPAKQKARAMLKMLDQINTTLLPQVPARAEPRVSVDCVTCHHGMRLPKSLQTTLFELVNERGADAAVARYRELRASDTLSGRYSFDEWEINELARRLFEAKNTAAAIALLEMNGEFYPKSAAIDFQIAELHLIRGERDLALARYRKTLEKQPNHARAKTRIAELEKR
jgi:tetratricopeptide (TPR) repeat protein